MVVKGFQTKAELQKYLNDESIPFAKIASIYYDAASGEHVLVYDNSI